MAIVAQCDCLKDQPSYSLHAAMDMIWPKGIVYFHLDTAYDPREKNMIHNAMKMISDETAVAGRHIVSFKQREQQRDYISIRKHRTRCSSTIGREGGEQRMLLGRPCLRTLGRVQHELLHILGFFHEHQRPDRDKFIRIVWKNIEIGKYHDFMRLHPGLKMHPGLPYDYESILHYPKHAFAVDKTRTSIQTPDQEDIGQRSKLSTLDKKRVRLLYGKTND